MLSDPLLILSLVLLVVVLVLAVALVRALSRQRSALDDATASLAGRLDEARPFLRRAFQLSPDLADFATDDTDLTALRTELQELAKPASG